MNNDNYTTIQHMSSDSDQEDDHIEENQEDHEFDEDCDESDHETDHENPEDHEEHDDSDQHFHEDDTDPEQDDHSSAQSATDEEEEGDQELRLRLLHLRKQLLPVKFRKLKRRPNTAKPRTTTTTTTSSKTSKTILKIRPQTAATLRSNRRRNKNNKNNKNNTLHNVPSRYLRPVTAPLRRKRDVPRINTANPIYFRHIPDWTTNANTIGPRLYQKAGGGGKLIQSNAIHYVPTPIPTAANHRKLPPPPPQIKFPSRMGSYIAIPSSILLKQHRNQITLTSKLNRYKRIEQENERKAIEATTKTHRNQHTTRMKSRRHHRMNNNVKMKTQSSDKLDNTKTNRSPDGRHFALNTAVPSWKISTNGPLGRNNIGGSTTSLFEGWSDNGSAHGNGSMLRSRMRNTSRFEGSLSSVVSSIISY